MGLISYIMVNLFRAQPFESEALDKLAESMKAAPILKRDKLHRYYKSNSLPICCISCSDSIVFNSNCYQMFFPNEVLAVGAHEFNHIAKKHVLNRLPRTLFPSIIFAILTSYLLFINSYLNNSINSFFNFDRGFHIVFIAFFSMPFFLILSLHVNAKWLRQQEIECDLSAAKFVDAFSTISALEKLRPQKTSGWATVLSRLMPQTHPKIEQRIHFIQEAMK